MDTLLARYQEWFEIARSEHEVIKEQRWHELNTCTLKKQEIMKAITETEAENAPARTASSEAVRMIIHQLADLEQLNHLLLNERMAEVKTRMDDIARRKQTIRQLRKRYQDSGPGSGGQVSGQA